MKNMVESSSASSSCCSSSNAAAMSLWQKYSDLQQEAERCRAEARSVRAKVDGLKQQMECLQQQQDRDASATVDAVQLTRTLRRQYTGEPPPAQGSAVDDEPAATDANRSSNALWIPEAGSSDGGRVLSLRAQWDAVETAYAAAVADGDRAVQAHALARAMRDEQRQERVAESRAFRQVQCPQWRLAAANVGLESGAFVTAALQSAHVAAAASDVICDTDGVSAVRQMITDDEEEASCCWMAVDTEEDAWDVNDPATWVIPDDDDELKEAVAAYKESTKARQAAAAELRDVWKPKEAALRENCRNREERTQQLQQQLARIDKDCSDLSSQLSQLQQLTVEDVALAQMYRTKIQQRHTPNQQRKHSSTARRVNYDSTPGSRPRVQSSHPMVATLIPPVRNTSEATAMTTSTTAATSKTFNPYATSNKRQKTNIALTPSPAVTAARGNSGDQQSRREDLATIILGPRGSTTGRRFHRDKQFGCSLEIFHGDDADDDSMEDTDGTTNQTIATANSHRRIESTCHRRENSVTAADDEDDDDDALLNYVAFSKRV